MIRALRPVLILGLAALLSGAVAAAGDEGAEVVTHAGAGIAVSVPSGLDVTLHDVISNAPGTEGLTLRFRFLAPQIADSELDYDATAMDMQHLCDSFALPRLSDFGPAPQQIVISLAAAEVPFGQAAPDVVQFFESYRIEDGICVWEMF